MKVEIKDSTSLLNGGIYEVIEEFDNGYFIACHGNNCREFVLKEHTKILSSEKKTETQNDSEVAR